MYPRYLIIGSLSVVPMQHLPDYEVLSLGAGSPETQLNTSTTPIFASSHRRANARNPDLLSSVLIMSSQSSASKLPIARSNAPTAATRARSRSPPD